MPLQGKPLIGALVIAAFITGCLGWLFHGIGKPMPLWGYPVVFAVFAAWLCVIGRLLVGNGRTRRVRSFDISLESQ